MKQIDYLIIGCGLAGIAFCEKLKANNKSFMVFDDDSQKSSSVAGGLYNPVILKRFTPVWKSREQLDIALPFYKKLENNLNTKLDYKTPVYRLFNSIEEQNNWFIASDKKGLAGFMSTNIITNTNQSIKASYGFGEVLETGRIDTSKLIKGYREKLVENNQLISEIFKYDDLELQSDLVIYKNIQAKYLIFSEGFGLKKNPFFNKLPLIGTKGELITIHAPELQIDYVLKSSVFIIPIGKDLYRIGSTYERKDKTHKVTQEAKQELLNKLTGFLKCDFTVVNQVAGIRPTVKDRRPLVGSHKQYKNLFVLNGLGTRGVMIGPYVANQLYNHIEKAEELEKEIDINRFN